MLDVTCDLWQTCDAVAVVAVVAAVVVAVVAVVVVAVAAVAHTSAFFWLARLVVCLLTCWLFACHCLLVKSVIAVTTCL